MRLLSSHSCYAGWTRRRLAEHGSAEKVRVFFLGDSDELGDGRDPAWPVSAGTGEVLLSSMISRGMPDYHVEEHDRHTRVNTRSGHLTQAVPYG
jgi:hypothetical protein